MPPDNEVERYSFNPERKTFPEYAMGTVVFH
jgi:hypothetical protein